MGSMTIRQIDDETKAKLRQRAALNGRSVEGEVRFLIARALTRDNDQRYPLGTAPQTGEDIGAWLVRISRPGSDVEFPPRNRASHEPVEL